MPAQSAPAATSERRISDSDRFPGARVVLRLLRLEDCTDRYLGWLQDPLVNQYLETRWQLQSIESIREFVSQMAAGPENYLFAMIEKESGTHIGNIKVGPINRFHGFADVSYFVGEREWWGKGIATDAIRTATRIAFERLGLHRIQAGVYEANAGSARALEKAGFAEEGRFRKQFVAGDGRQDHIWYGILREELDG